MGTTQRGTTSPTPLFAVLGHLYVSRSTGRLSLFDSDTASSPYMEFWFKYGVPCFSTSKESSTRLGNLLPPRAKAVVDQIVRKAAGDGHHAPLTGQLLCAQSIISNDELNRALVEQITRRLMTGAAMQRSRLEFQSGYTHFAGVPLSSPPVSPLELAARCSLLAPLDTVQQYLLRKIKSPKIALSKDRRIPATVRELLSAPLLGQLSMGMDLEGGQPTPSAARTLCFLAAFGFLEAQKSAQTEAAQPKAANDSVHDALLPSMQTMEKATNHYLLLGLALDATATEIRRNYRVLALKAHPDRAQAHNTSAAQTLFSRLVQAHESLCKESRRLLYDEELVASGEWKSLGSAESVSRCFDSRAAALQARGLSLEANRYSALAQMVVGNGSNARWAFAYAWA